MKKSSNRRFAIGSLIIIAAFTALVLTSMRANTFRSVPVSELRAADNTSHSFVGQRLRVVGFVGPGAVQKTPLHTADGLETMNRFAIEEKGATINVEYHDALPDVFRPGGPVQVDGVYQAPGFIKADHVLTKCPSKYNSETKYNQTVAPKLAERAASMK